MFCTASPQAKAYQELVDIFGDSDREPTFDDLKSMNYLENCIKDSLRLFPSIPAIGRKLTQDEEIGWNTFMIIVYIKYSVDYSGYLTVWKHLEYLLVF